VNQPPCLYVFGRLQTEAHTFTPDLVFKKYIAVLHLLYFSGVGAIIFSVGLKFLNISTYYYYAHLLLCKNRT